LKYRTIEISGIGVELPVETLTSSGLPAVSIQALKNLAGKVSVNCDEIEEEEDFIPGGFDAVLTSAGVEDVIKTDKQSDEDLSVYGKAYQAFNGGQEGKEACKAIAALCEISAIDTLISSFIQPLQVSAHCLVFSYVMSSLNCEIVIIC
jgi:DNA polymerase-1